jgi:Zn-dependent protease
LYGIYLERDEVIQIIICVISISFALALVFASPQGMLGHPIEFLVFIIPLLVTVGSGFILHEMSHKLVAMYYGAQARFRMWIQGLVVMLIGSVFGVLFAAPGAVYIYSNNITKRENGIISLAGPMLNIALAGFFIILEFVAPIKQFYSFLAVNGMDFAGYGMMNGVLHVWWFGAALNIVLALFNMIPAFPLDGSKVFAWSKLVWGAFVLLLFYIGVLVIGWGLVIGWVIMLAFFGLLSYLLFGNMNKRLNS